MKKNRSGKVAKEKKTFTCNVCSKPFPKLSLLNRHAVTHTKQDHFCGKCGKKYTRNDHFDKHVAICDGEQPSTSKSQDPTYEMDDLPSTSQTQYDEMDDLPSMCQTAWVVENVSDVEEGPDVVGTVSDVEEGLDVVGTVSDVEEGPVVVEHNSDGIASTSRMYISRKSRTLASALETIQRMRVDEQAKVFRNAMETSKTSLETILVNSDVETINDAKLLNGLVRHLKGIKLYSRESNNQFCSLLWGMCGDSLMDNDFVKWLALKLDKKPHRLEKIISLWLSVTTEPLESRGRKGLSKDAQQTILNAWLNESMITVDRRSGRDQVVMKKTLFEQKFGHFEFPGDIVIEEFTTKRNQLMVRTTRRIAIKTFKEMKAMLKVKHNMDVSTGSIFKYKPYFVQTATEREKECCLCKVCLNIRLKYRALVHYLKEGVEKTDSLTEYFGHGVKCPMGANGYY